MVGLLHTTVTAIKFSMLQNKKMKKAKVIKVKNGYCSTKTIKKLKKKKRYYFRIRAYKKVQGKTVYAKWSKKRSAKVK